MTESLIIYNNEIIDKSSNYFDKYHIGMNYFIILDFTNTSILYQ